MPLPSTTHLADVAVAAFLDTKAITTADGVVTLGLGANMFRGPVRPANATGLPIPHQCLFVLETGGRSPDFYFGSQAQTGPGVKYANVQVHIRGNVDRFRSGEDLSRGVRDALHLANLGASWMRCVAKQSEPTYLGMNPTQHHQWSINFDIWYNE